jgi:ribosomal protein S18 acetylase RimI-like enzyme
MLIRRAQAEERDQLGAFVLTITDEVYGYLWTMPSLAGARSGVAARIRNEDWSRAWVAFKDEILVGTLLTDAEWIDDLWVCKEYRGRGIGRQLLARGETEIAARGYETLRLRVVRANSRAVGFYERLGWKIEKEFPHETLGGVSMLELSKRVDSTQTAQSSSPDGQYPPDDQQPY